jgi:hypothetical protein
VTDIPVLTLIDQSLERLRTAMPGARLELSPFDEDGFATLLLPPPQDGDYQLGLAFSDDGERQMYAVLVERPGQPVPPPHNTFWYWPFELAGFKHQPEALATTFDVALEAMLPVPTRIRQERGRFLHRFELERASSVAADTWIHVYGYAASQRGGFVAPPIDGREFIYHSPAIAPVTI